MAGSFYGQFLTLPCVFSGQFGFQKEILYSCKKRRDGDGYLYINAQLPGIIRNFTFKCSHIDSLFQNIDEAQTQSRIRTWALMSIGCRGRITDWQCYLRSLSPAPNHQPPFLSITSNDSTSTNYIQTNPNYTRRRRKHPTLKTPPRPLRQLPRLPPILPPLNTRPPPKWHNSHRRSGTRCLPPRRRPTLQLRPRQRLHDGRNN